jgi:ribonuclease-3
LQRVNPSQQSPASRNRLLADALEAVLGALFLTHGMPAVQAVVERDWAPLLTHQPTHTKDAKTALQEYLQAQGHALPSYTLLKQTGPDHAASFTVAVHCALGEAMGEGNSKQAASMAAAAALMERVDS